MPSETLVSLAMLKVRLDRESDYLEYLTPFIQEVLVRHHPDRVTDSDVSRLILSEFGLAIPDAVVQILLKRFAKRKWLIRADHTYDIGADLPDPSIAARRAAAIQDIDSVIDGLTDYSKDTGKPLSSREQAVSAVCAFLSKFSIVCLRAYLRGTAIPAVGAGGDEIVLVSQYVIHLQRSDPSRFGSLLVLVQGHMLANALLCPDLQFAPKSYKGTTFYLDTPLLVHRLGLDGPARKAAVETLIQLLRDLGATVATFSHCRHELEHVIRASAEAVGDRAFDNSIVREARRRGTSKSDLLLTLGSVGELLADAGIVQAETPRYAPRFQIDEQAFSEALDDEVSYMNPRAKDNDINSVRSVYVLREGSSPSRLEDSKAVLVTSNTAFARAAYLYGQAYEESREVSTVITGFSLANAAWLKSPVRAPSLPETEILAYCFAALEPSRELLDKYLNEVDKLEQSGRISARDHQVLRSSMIAEEELMRQTLGDEEALREGCIPEILARVTQEIRSEDLEALARQERLLQATQDALDLQRDSYRKVRDGLHRRCERTADALSWIAVAPVVGLSTVGFVVGSWLLPTSPIPAWALIVVAGILAVLGAIDQFGGSIQRRFRETVKAWLLAKLLQRELSTLGIDVAGPEA